MKKIFKRKNHVPTSQVSPQFTQFLAACIEGETDTVIALLDVPSFDPNHLDTDHRLTPLMLACYHAQEAVVDILLRSPAINIAAKNLRQQTVLHTICSLRYENLSMLRLLATHADFPSLLGLQDEDGMTALHIAAEKDQAEVFRFLFQHSSKEILVLNNQKHTPFTLAWVKNSGAVAETMLDAVQNVRLLGDMLATVRIHFSGPSIEKLKESILLRMTGEELRSIASERSKDAISYATVEQLLQEKNPDPGSLRAYVVRSFAPEDRDLALYRIDQYFFRKYFFEAALLATTDQSGQKDNVLWQTPPEVIKNYLDKIDNLDVLQEECEAINDVVLQTIIASWISDTRLRRAVPDTPCPSVASPQATPSVSRSSTLSSVRLPKGASSVDSVRPVSSLAIHDAGALDPQATPSVSRSLTSVLPSSVALGRSRTTGIILQTPPRPNRS